MKARRGGKSLNQSQAATQQPSSLCRSDAVPCNQSNIFIQLNQNHLVQHSTLPSNIINALNKPEDIPMTMPATITKYQTSGRVPAPHSHYATIAEGKSKHNADDCTNGNDSDDDEINRTPRYYNNKTDDKRAYAHRNANNNNTIAATNRYRWHSQSDDIPLQCINNGTISAAHINYHRTHSVHQPRQKHYHHQQQNQINNNFIVANKKPTINAYDTNNGEHYIDQSNGNHLSSQYYH